MIENHLLQGEIDWINANVDRYESPAHAQAVIGNITKMYFIRESQRLVKAFDTRRTTGDMFKLFEHFGLTGV